jgi:hypothetical protein
VKFGIARGTDLADLPLETLKTFHAAIDDDVYAVLTLRGSLEARQVQGGTAPERVREQIAAHRARLTCRTGNRCTSHAPSRRCLPAPVVRRLSPQRGLRHFHRARRR